MTDQMEYGWKEMARLTGLSVRSLYRRKQQLQQDGIIGYQTVGKPPVRKMRFFPDVLKAYITRKNINGENF